MIKERTKKQFFGAIFLCIFLSVSVIVGKILSPFLYEQPEGILFNVIIGFTFFFAIWAIKMIFGDMLVEIYNIVDEKITKLKKYLGDKKDD